MHSCTPTLRSSRHRPAWALIAAAVGAAGCAGAETEAEVANGALYASVQGIDGVYLHPPLGPEPAPSGRFDPSLLERLSVSVEAVGADGAVSALATFDHTTQPTLALLPERERYWVNVPAATYIDDPSKTYRFRVLLDGSELATSVLSAHIFTVLAYDPSLPIGVHVRVEGSGEVLARVRASGGSGRRLHCSDGIRNKDETGVDCGGSCAPCPTCSDGIQNQGETGVDCGGPCTPCETCSDGIKNQSETGVDCGGPCAVCCTDLETISATRTWDGYGYHQCNRVGQCADATRSRPEYAAQDACSLLNGAWINGLCCSWGSWDWRYGCGHANDQWYPVGRAYLTCGGVGGHECTGYGCPSTGGWTLNGTVCQRPPPGCR